MKTITLALVAFAGHQMVSAQFPGHVSTDPRRRAVQAEMLYSMRFNWDSTNYHVAGGHQIGSNFCSNWNYLDSDASRFWPTVARMGSFSTVGTPFRNPGYGPNQYGLQNGYGRGGQCTFYPCLIWRRSLGINFAWSYANAQRSSLPLNQALPGDAIFRTGTGQHVAMLYCWIDGGRRAWIAESNWAGFGNQNFRVRGATTNNSEIMSMRLVNASELSAYRTFRIPM